VPRFENTTYVTIAIVRMGSLELFREEKFALETGTTMYITLIGLCLGVKKKLWDKKRLLELVPQVVLKSCSSEVILLRLLHATFCAQF
jgi:hypothetical protein